jgi:hypothetical protein
MNNNFIIYLSDNCTRTTTGKAVMNSGKDNNFLLASDIICDSTCLGNDFMLNNLMFISKCKFLLHHPKSGENFTLAIKFD